MMQDGTKVLVPGPVLRYDSGNGKGEGDREMQLPVGTKAMFAGLTVTIVSNYETGNYPTTRVEYRTGNRETIASDAIKPLCGCWNYTRLGSCIHTI